MFPKSRSWVWPLVMLTAPLAAAESDSADAFRWTVEAADCNYLIQSHQRDEKSSRDEPTETLRLRAGAGTYVYARHRVDHSRLIDDLNVILEVESDRRGIQVLGRIVLPDTIDPKTGRRATMLIAGESYSSVGRWQRLRLDRVMLKVERQVRVLRARLQQPVDTRGAFLDSIVVNVYGGPGTTQVRLGQPKLTGSVAPDERPAGQIVTTTYDRPDSTPSTPPRRRSNRLIVDNRPFFPRVIEYRGEPFKLLRTLGFNTLFLDRAPTAEQRREAKQLNLWIVAPPPNQVLPSDVEDERILGWFSGEKISFAKLPAGYLDRVRRRDPHRRPLIGNVERDQWRASREFDILLRGREALGSSFQLSHVGPWLEQMTQLARPGTPFWSYVQTELSAEVVEQARLLMDRETPLPRVLQVEQIRQIALSAIAAGARGLWFRSGTALDGADHETQIRRLMLELINDELTLIEPWAMGGERLGEVHCENAEVRVVALATERSRLLIPTYVQHDAQFACRPTTGANAMVIAGVSDSADVYHLSHIGLAPLRKQRISGGLRIEVEPELADSLLLITEDPLVITHINRTVAASKQRVVQLEQELADLLLADFETSAARKLLETSERIETWETARQSLQTSRDLARANDLSSAFRFARQANRELNKLQANTWREMTEHWPSPLYHPAGVSFPTAMAVDPSRESVLGNVRWSSNALRGGGCENLDLMIDAGWRQHQSSPEDVGTYIALSPHQPHGGRSCLRMLASAKTPDAAQSVVEMAPVWINSAPITVEPGQRARISGWIRINRPIRGSLDGCVIADSMSGERLALRFQQTDGWEHFQMIRAMTRHDHLTVMISLHGLGEVWIDDLKVELD